MLFGLMNWAKLSQGWPQHINRIGVAAGRVIRTNEGHLEEHLIEQAVEKGIDRKNAYYLGRVEAGSNRAWVYKQLALAAGKVAGELVDTLSYDEVDRLTENARTRKGESIDEFLDQRIACRITGSGSRGHRIATSFRFPL